jgi:N-methylhydantoinase B
VVSFQTGGGGGYGSPLERESEKVLLDVINGYVSLQKAREEYGVVINEDRMKIDIKATKQLRNKMRKVS